MDEYILRPLFLHKYEKGKLTRMENFYNLFVQNPSKFGEIEKEVDDKASQGSDKSKSVMVMRKLKKSSRRP